MSAQPSLGEKTQRFVDSICSVNGVVSCALISPDGLIMGKCFRDGASLPSLFAAMCATIMASAEAAAGIISIQSPASVAITAEDAVILVMNAGKQALITAIIETSGDYRYAYQQIAAIATQIAEEV